jgi:hypothetical protein
MTPAALLCVCLGAWGQEDGRLTVRSDPEGVEVWLDDQYIGDTPILEKKLKPGRYMVKLIDAARHTSLSEEIFIQAGQTTLVEKTIETKFGSLRVNSDPEGAEVHLSLPLGKTPVSNDFMNPGKYRVEIRHPSAIYAPAVEDITIPRGKTVTLDKKLEKQSPFDMKALVRLGLGAGAIAGFVWAVVEQHEYSTLSKEIELGREIPTEILGPEKLNEKRDERTAASVKRTVGIVVGSLCVIGFEIVAFF